MTPELLALAAAVTALPGWRWAPGMRDTKKRTVLAVDADGVPTLWATVRAKAVMGRDETQPRRAMRWRVTVPDLADAPTGGAMLDLLGEERASVYPWSDGYRWKLIHAQPLSPAMPLAEACARVALARGRWS